MNGLENERDGEYIIIRQEHIGQDFVVWILDPDIDAKDAHHPF